MRDTANLFISLVALPVAANASSATLASLYYNDSVAEDGLWIDGQLGHGVIFTAPVDKPEPLRDLHHGDAHAQCHFREALH